MLIPKEIVLKLTVEYVSITFLINLRHLQLRGGIIFTPHILVSICSKTNYKLTLKELDILQLRSIIRPDMSWQDRLDRAKQAPIDASMRLQEELAQEKERQAAALKEALQTSSAEAKALLERLGVEEKLLGIRREFWEGLGDIVAENVYNNDGEDIGTSIRLSHDVTYNAPVYEGRKRTVTGPYTTSQVVYGESPWNTGGYNKQQYGRHEETEYVTTGHTPGGFEIAMGVIGVGLESGLVQIGMFQQGSYVHTRLDNRSLLYDDPTVPKLSGYELKGLPVPGNPFGTTVQPGVTDDAAIDAFIDASLLTIIEGNRSRNSLPHQLQAHYNSE